MSPSLPDSVSGPESARPVADAMVDPRLLQANERTFLAWIRTAVGLMAFGFVIARLGLWLRMAEAPDAAGFSVSVLVGVGVVVFASALSVASAARFLGLRRALRSGLPLTTSPALEMTLSFGVAVVGVVLAAYLLLR